MSRVALVLILLPAVAADLAPSATQRSPLSMPAPITGTATWYCGSGSPCTSGHRPGELIAAAGSELRSGAWRGRVVAVEHAGRRVLVKLVDACACAGDRVIDLSQAAFAQLASPGRGVIPVTVRPALLPQTDMAP